MKVWKVVMAIALASVGQVGIAMAYGNPDNGPGCGLGKLAWADFKRQKDIAPQVLMATTNGTFGSQTFGISFGTSAAARMMGKSGRNIRPSSSWQPRSKILQRTWHGDKANI